MSSVAEDPAEEIFELYILIPMNVAVTRDSQTSQCSVWKPRCSAKQVNINNKEDVPLCLTTSRIQFYIFHPKYSDHQKVSK